MTRPLILRPDMRYECHGDGTCCTDIHLLGPLSRREARRVEQLAGEILPPDALPAVIHHEGIEQLVFSSPHGSCVFLDEQARCRLHQHAGFDDKPDVCRHFPVGSTLTPRGLRVTLSHRCPCVSVGQSRLLDERRARDILRKGRSRRIEPDVRTGNSVRWRGKNYVSFEQYERWEQRMLDRLDGNQAHWPIERVLSIRSDKLPKLQRSSWKRLGKRFKKWADEPMDGFFATVQWTSLAMRDKLDKKRSKLPPRPWLWTFERTLARAPDPTPVRRIYGRWLADTLWSMSWSVEGSLYRALADLSARYVLAIRLARRFRQLGARQDLAAAEAVMVLDTVSASDPWQWVRRRLAEPPAGTYGSPSRDPSGWDA